MGFVSITPHLFLYAIIRIGYNKATREWYTLKVIFHVVCFIAKVTPNLRVRSKVWLLEAQDPKSRLTPLYLSLDLKLAPSFSILKVL